jgi:hypothetical protein
MNTHSPTPMNGRSQPSPSSAAIDTGRPSSRSREATIANAPTVAAA